MRKGPVLATVVLYLLWAVVLSQQANAQATYTLKPTPKTVAWGYYDAKAAPVLRVKSVDMVETQRLVPPATAQEEKQPIIYVRHLEPPYYPPLARQTRVSGTIVMKLKIGTDGKVLAIESESSNPAKSGSTILKDDAEKIVKTWTFGCVGCPPDAPFEHTIKFKYILDDNLPPSTSKTIMDLPDEVTMSCGPTILNTEDTKIPKKGSH